MNIEQLLTPKRLGRILYEVIAEGNIEAARFLIDNHPTDPNCLYTVDTGYETEVHTPLSAAIKQAHVNSDELWMDIIKALIAKGADCSKVYMTYDHVTADNQCMWAPRYAENFGDPIFFRQICEIFEEHGKKQGGWLAHYIRQLAYTLQYSDEYIGFEMIEELLAHKSHPAIGPTEPSINYIEILACNSLYEKDDYGDMVEAANPDIVKKHIDILIAKGCVIDELDDKGNKTFGRLFGSGRFHEFDFISSNYAVDSDPNYVNLEGQTVLDIYSSKVIEGLNGVDLEAIDLDEIMEPARWLNRKGAIANRVDLESIKPLITHNWAFIELCGTNPPKSALALAKISAWDAGKIADFKTYIENLSRREILEQPRSTLDY